MSGNTVRICWSSVIDAGSCPDQTYWVRTRVKTRQHARALTTFRWSLHHIWGKKKTPLYLLNSESDFFYEKERAKGSHWDVWYWAFTYVLVCFSNKEKVRHWSDRHWIFQFTSTWTRLCSKQGYRIWTSFLLESVSRRSLYSIVVVLQFANVVEKVTLIKKMDLDSIRGDVVKHLEK